MLFHLLSSKECTCNAMMPIFLTPELFYKHLSATDHHSRYDHLFWRMFSHLNHAISSSPLLHLESVGVSRLFLTEFYIRPYHFQIHPPWILTQTNPWRISQTMNRKILYNPHGSAPFWATNFHLNDPWILQWELIPPEISETLHMHQKKTQLSTVYPRPSSQRWHSRCPFPPSLPVVLHARALWELSGKDCSVISHNC